ncbi:hypothetical protein BCEP4_1980017 [Burkholderia cepacia]|nr:hypothetical protein BCEP4_1980017 [Burkholderia cepacia]
MFLDGGKTSLVGKAGFPTLIDIDTGPRAQCQWSRLWLSGDVLIGRVDAACGVREQGDAGAGDLELVLLARI